MRGDLHRTPGSVSRVVAVTGATGYVGRHLCVALAAAGLRAVPLVRNADLVPAAAWPGAERARSTGDLTERPDWARLLSGIDAVVHAAALAHSNVGGASGDDGLRRVNTDVVLELAGAAARAGVARLVFLSSVGVYGPIPGDRAATEDMLCRPVEPYAVTKRDAELGLEAGPFGRRMQVAIVRPPMIHGPHCPGNLRRLAALVRPGLPLPLASLDGRRNLVGVDALCAGLVRLLRDDGDVSGTWNIAEPDELDVPSIVRALSEGMRGRPIPLLPLPVGPLTRLASLVGRADMIRKLDAPVLVDGERFRKRFTWRPERPTRESLVAVGRSFAR